MPKRIWWRGQKNDACTCGEEEDLRDRMDRYRAGIVRHIYESAEDDLSTRAIYLVELHRNDKYLNDRCGSSRILSQPFKRKATQSYLVADANSDYDAVPV